ncbi:MAG TPA: tripartite tricarboxylate transporter TctB family protein, partial [Burkholderiaceae bacterium]|nr:tripartite tricarboxylate transporter TctB family protein [Burkholderiaceae bacterium]
MAHTPGNPAHVRTSKGDFIVALSFIAIGIATVIAVSRFPEQTHGILDPQSVSFFPLLIAAILIGAAVRVALRTRRSPYEAPAATETPPRLRRCLLAAFTLPVYAAAIFTLGFWPSSSLAIVAMAVLLSS